MKQIAPIKKKSKSDQNRTCLICEFNGGDMCLIHGQGYKAREEYHTCNDWSISASALERQKKRGGR